MSASRIASRLARAAAIAALALGAAPSSAEADRPLRTEALEARSAWDGSGPAVNGRSGTPAYGIPMPWGQESFEAMRTAYLGPDARKWLSAILARAAPYLPYIRERIRLYGLPDELAFLPVLESEFSARAVSRSGAAGLWQFMKNSVGGYGMRIDDWVDERRDFMKSTDGALRKLADNYETFGDWHLALAAYNAGAGAVGRALTAAKLAGAAAPDYWEIRRRGLLSAECSAYVPKFLAIASILGYPARSGIALDWEGSPGWETLRVGRPVDLAKLAAISGIEAELLRDFNPELRYGVTPPDPEYRLKIPAPRAETLRAALAETSIDVPAYRLHSVRSGDTLSALARSYGTSVAAIASANQGLDPDRIRLGQVIVVPASPTAPQRNGDGPDEEGPDFAGTYTVAKGDTLWSISLKHSVRVELLAARNGLDLGEVIREGKRLAVPIISATP